MGNNKSLFALRGLLGVLCCEAWKPEGKEISQEFLVASIHRKAGVDWGVCGVGWGVGLGCESWPIMSALVTVDIGPAVLSETTCPTSLLLPLNINQAVLRSAGLLSAQVWQRSFVWLWHILPAVPPSDFLFVFQLASGWPPAGRKLCA